MEDKLLLLVVFCCVNSSCTHKTFSSYGVQSNLEELNGRKRYTRSSRSYVVSRLLQPQVSYNALCDEIATNFKGKTSLSTLHTWVSELR